MSHLWPSRVRETTTTTGTGTYTLAGAVTGYRTFASVMSDGDTVDACIRMGANWEVGRYTFNAGTLARTAVLASSNADAAVNWVAGTKDVFAIHIGFSDLDATGIANLALLVGALGVTGTPSAGQFPQFSGAAQLQALSAAAFRAALDLEAGTDFLAPAAIAAAYQPLDSDLTAIAALTTTTFGRAFLAFADEAAFKAAVNLEGGTDFLVPASNLSDLASAATARSNLSAAKKGKWEATREVTSASGTLAATDAGGCIYMNRASAQTLNIPANASVAIDVDTIISTQQLGAGLLTIDAPTGVTLNGVDGGSCTVTRRYGGATLAKRGTDDWVVTGAHTVVV